MTAKRILSLWFPRLGAERLLRQRRQSVGEVLAVVADQGNMQVLSSVSAAAAAAGLVAGQPLRDAMAMCPELVTQRRNPQAELDFLKALRRWAGKFSPWVSDAPPASLLIDLTGCAHLFGGEQGVLQQVEADCEDLGLTVQAGVADTVGAAWALARFAGRGGEAARSGDAIDQEARATRSRAAKRRHWERGGAAPKLALEHSMATRIAASGQAKAALAGLPVSALRLPEETVAQLVRLGLRRVGDLAEQPRAGLARRFGREVMLRLDQAFGAVPEPVSGVRPPVRFALRLTLPEPIGLIGDVLAGLDRLLEPLCARLRAKGQGARRVRMQVMRCDQSSDWVEIGLAMATEDPARIRPLLAMKLQEVDAGAGIDVLRIEAHQTEPVYAVQHKGHFSAAEEGRRARDAGAALEDLIGRLGARIGLEAITRLHPGDSHIPEKTTQIRAAAWSVAATDWPRAIHAPRPLSLFRPEPVSRAEPELSPLGPMRWRGRALEVIHATGPERIAPEWWLDEPEWRSGVRDYWRIETACGERLWMFYAYGGALSAGWFCQGGFA